MEIGKPKRTITVEPLEDPVPRRRRGGDPKQTPPPPPAAPPAR
jgi:hypothetical protein